MSITRRSVLKGTAAASAAAVAAPAILKASDALASSGQVNVFAWGDYIQENMITKFEGDTGIKINLSTFGSNDEAEQKLKAAGGKGFDVIFPSITNGTNYYGEDLLAPLDESRLNVSAIVPSMMRDSVRLGGTYRGRRMLLPFDWGTEAITFDSSVFPLADDEVSYGSLWTPDAVGKATFRQKSGMIGVGLYLETTGALQANRMLDVYKSEEDAHRIWGQIANFIIEHKQNIAAFWNNGTEATNAFKQAGASVGQSWDTTGLLLSREDPKWKYRMPKEGGMTWMDSIGIPSGAENTQQAYAFINAMLDPQMAGMFSANTGYNSAVVGAANHAGETYKNQFLEIYNDDTLANLWWYPADTPWFATLRQEYVERITNA
ncbi:spermidine/putrescine ABC transporter substrate-binding protein [Pseudovibrio japonicus]|uniref:Spermidine/putrescine ABC transporter substrate-binding protein n=1 Tax=Pseudovibrio japonicus TaxID=366534 RepID=A0ABQ3E6L5_9HYPH|nr:extracellular solute-binding protein [Pseudovibrio japonicus]GHB21111.1 spermidine/putrescine ABC transporter substrate-binding protein [Pseudovibrio japonicus]